MFKLKTDKDFALEILSAAKLHGFKTATFMVRKNNPSQTLNLEAIAEWIEYFQMKEAK